MATGSVSPKAGKIVDIPNTPTIGTATTGPESASVTFTASSVGGPVRTYTALSSPGSITGTGTTSPITITGLTAGTSYTFQVRGENATGNSPYSSASNSVTPTADTSFESIATVSVGSGGSSSISFSSIPGTYSHLQLRYLVQDNRGTYADSEMKIQFNSDTGTNYSGHYLRGTGSVEAAWNGNESRLKQNCTSTAAGSNFAVGVIDIFDYANTNKYKTVRILGGFDNSSSGGIWLRSGLWMSTSAITSIQIGSDLGTLINQYSHFALYGIKAA